MYTRLQNLLMFFELDWVKLSRKKAREMLQSPDLKPYHHYLKTERLMKPFRLSEAEEKIMAEMWKEISGKVNPVLIGNTLPNI